MCERERRQSVEERPSYAQRIVRLHGKSAEDSARLAQREALAWSERDRLRPSFPAPALCPARHWLPPPQIAGAIPFPSQGLYFTHCQCYPLQHAPPCDVDLIAQRWHSGFPTSALSPPLHRHWRPWIASHIPLPSPVCYFVIG